MKSCLTLAPLWRNRQMFWIEPKLSKRTRREVDSAIVGGNFHWIRQQRRDEGGVGSGVPKADSVTGSGLPDRAAAVSVLRGYRHRHLIWRELGKFFVFD